jgi:mono/diheme cytochrome c family protein
VVGVLSAALGGCGSSAGRPPTTGKQVFAASCAACHSLVGNESARKQGGDLLGYRMSRAVVLSFTREMPAAPRLSAEQLRAVSDYVYAAQQRYAGARGGAR